MKHLEEALSGLVERKTVENIFVRVGKGERVLYDTCRGRVDENTLFDMASVTKIMATTSLALIAIDRGLLGLEEPVGKFFPTEKPLTVGHLLTHTCGLGHRWVYKESTYETVGEYILTIPEDIPIGSDVLYSCPGFILLGKILEKVWKMPLNEAFDALVAKPLGLKNTSFLPKNKENCVNANLEEEMRGVVNDCNCRFLGGIVGNAGLFSCVSDVTKYVQALLSKGAPLIGEETFARAAENYTPTMHESRGLGFLYVDDRYPQTGGFFKDGAIGHCGHTGQSVFLDYRTGVYAIVLSDATVSTIKKYGYEDYGEVMNMRAEIHAAIKKDFKE